MTLRYAGVELGGTTVRVAIAQNDPKNLLEIHEIPTTDPLSTLTAVAEWLECRGPLDALGIASFGPVDLLKSSPT